MKSTFKILLVAVFVAHSCALPQPGAPAAPPAAPAAKPPAAPAAPAAAPAAPAAAAPPKDDNKALGKAADAMKKAAAAGSELPDNMLAGADILGHTTLTLIESLGNQCVKTAEATLNKEIKLFEDWINLL